MNLIILLFLLGVVLLAVEVIVPGGIIGAIGGLMMFGGCVLAFMDYGALGGCAGIAVALLLAGITFYVEFRILPKTAVGKRAFLHSQITGTSAALGEEERSLIGRTGEALTMLSPSGYIRIDGKRYEAFCQNGQAPAGAALEVIGADNFRLIVSQTTTN